MDEDYAFFERGPEAILAAVAADTGTLKLDALAMACARRMRKSTTEEQAVAWARAAAACYEAAAEPRHPGFDRQGSEVGLFGVKAALILKWGVASQDDVRDPIEIERWLRELMDGHEGTEDFQRALERRAGTASPEHENAVLLRERLSVIGVPLFNASLISTDLQPWFVAAGLVEA